MAKEIYSDGVGGQPVSNVLKTYADTQRTNKAQTAGTDAEREFNIRERIAASLVDRIGEGPCMTPAQHLALVEDIGRIAVALPAIPTGKAKGAVMELQAAWAASFRLECRDCITKDCPKRDPEFPLNAVLAVKGIKRESE